MLHRNQSRYFENSVIISSLLLKLNFNNNEKQRTKILTWFEMRHIILFLHHCYTNWINWLLIHIPVLLVFGFILWSHFQFMNNRFEPPRKNSKIFFYIIMGKMCDIKWNAIYLELSYAASSVKIDILWQWSTVKNTHFFNLLPMYGREIIDVKIIFWNRNFNGLFKFPGIWKSQF